MTSRNFLDNKPLAVIVGPTASGKTKVSISLAKIMNSEIISADSMLIYKYMDIGTAKPTLTEREKVRHHLIDILEPWQEFSVAQYQKIALNLIDDLHKKECLPLLVGGTGLYVNSVMYQMNFTNSGYDPAFRLSMMEEAKKHGEHYMYERLRSIDPISTDKINSNDIKRIIRALEVYHMTGKPMSFYSHNNFRSDPKFSLAVIGLDMKRSKLYHNIDVRVDKMFDDGLIDEIKKLKDLGCNKTMQSMQGLGYKQLFDYLEGRTNLSETRDLIKRNTRRYAKRQLTWFRKDKRIYWLNTDEYSSTETIADEIALYLEGILF